MQVLVLWDFVNENRTDMQSWDFLELYPSFWVSLVDKTKLRIYVL